MNSVARFVQADPGHADRVVWAGRQDQFRFQLARFGRLRKNLRVEGVVWIRAEDRDAQFADGPLFHALGYAAREMREQVRVHVEGFQSSTGQAQADESSLRARF